jgi:hypothetical protein
MTAASRCLGQQVCRKDAPCAACRAAAAPRTIAECGAAAVLLAGLCAAVIAGLLLYAR